MGNCRIEGIVCRVLGTFGNLYSARHYAAAVERLAHGIGHRRSVDNDEIVVEALYKGVGRHRPFPAEAPRHGILLAADVHEHFPGLGSAHPERGTAFVVDLGIVVAAHIGHGRLGHLESEGLREFLTVDYIGILIIVGTVNGKRHAPHPVHIARHPGRFLHETAAELNLGGVGIGIVESRPVSPLVQQHGNDLLGRVVLHHSVDAHEFEHLLGIAASELAITGSVEMQMVGQVGKSARRYHMRGRYGLLDTINHGIGPGTRTAAVGIDHLAYKQGHLVRTESEILKEVLIYFLDLERPLEVVPVGFALMHEYALDDSVFLGDTRHFDQSRIRVVVIRREGALHPVGSDVGRIVRYLALHEAFDLDTADGDIDDAYPVVLRKVLNHGTPEIVRGRHSVAVTAERRQGLVPLTHDTARILIVDSREGEVTVADSHGVDMLGTCRALHVGLSETEEDMEIRILCAGRYRKAQGKQRN